MKVNKIILFEISDLVVPNRRYSGLGMGYIKSYLLSKLKKIDIKIVQEDFFNKIIENQPEIIGISSISYFYKDAVSFAKLLKKYLPNTLFFIGGNHITALPKRLDAVFDVGILGEGEETFLELINEYRKTSSNLIDLKTIKGIVFFKNKKIHINKRRELLKNIDQIPNIDRSDFQHPHYKYILTSRGCFFDCAYCGSKIFWGNNSVRLHSPEYVVREMKNLETNPLNEIFIWDEAFINDEERLKEIVALWRARRNKLSITTFVCCLKPNFINNEVCRQLKKMNVVKVFLLLDSGCDKVLLNNKTNSLMNQMAINALKSWEIDASVTLTINNLNENEESYKKTLSFVKSNAEIDYNLNINPPFPGTIYWERYLGLSKDINFHDFENFRFVGFEKLDKKYIRSLSNLGLETMIARIWEIEGVLNNKIKKHFWIGDFLKNVSPKTINEYKYRVMNKLNKIGYKVGLVKFPKFFREISIRVTNKCNLNCFMCLNAQYRSKNQNAESFNYELAQKMVPELAKNKVRVYLSGGEPLLNEDLFKIISLFRLNGLYVYIYTNGFFLEKYVDELIASDINKITVSLDHYKAEIHDKIRGVKGSFDRALRGISRISEKKHKIQIEIATVVSKENYLNLVDMYDYIESIGNIAVWNLQKMSFVNNAAYENIKNKKIKIEKESLSFDGLVINGNSYFNKSEIENLKKQLTLIKKKEKLYRTKINYDLESLKSLESYYLGKPPSDRSKCFGVFEEVQILGNKVCTWCGYEIGDLNSEKSLNDIWMSDTNRAFQEYILNKKSIPNCFRCSKMDFKF